MILSLESPLLLPLKSRYQIYLCSNIYNWITMIILSHRYHFLNFKKKWFTSFGIFCDRAWLQNPHCSPLHLIKILSPFITLCQTHAFESIFLQLLYTLFWFLLPLSIIISLLLFPTVFLIPNLGIPEIIPPPTFILWSFWVCVPQKCSHGTRCSPHDCSYQTTNYLSPPTCLYHMKTTKGLGRVPDTQVLADFFIWKLFQWTVHQRVWFSWRCAVNKSSVVLIIGGLVSDG